jgi:hypothetical protein
MSVTLLSIKLGISSEGKLILDREKTDFVKLEQLLKKSPDVPAEEVMAALYEIDKRFHECEDFITTKFGVEEEA